MSSKKSTRRLGASPEGSPFPFSGNKTEPQELSVIVNKKPRLEAMEMLCDHKLSPNLDKYELTKFLNCHSTNLLIGKPGSGKTSLMVSFFDKLLRSCYNNIFLFQPSHSRASMKRDIFEEIPEEQKFDELNYENLSGVLDAIKSDDPEYTHCIIFDDMGAYLKNNDIRKLLKEIIYNRRHYHISVYFLCQSYLSCEKDIRKLFSNVFIFRVSKNELETIFDELIESKKELILPLSRLVYDNPHQYMFINTDTQRIFKGFDEVVQKTTSGGQIVSRNNINAKKDTSGKKEEAEEST